MIILPESYHSNDDPLGFEQIRIWNPSKESDVTFYQYCM